MVFQTTLIRVHKQRLFIYRKARLIESQIPELEVDLRPRVNSRARSYDRLAARCFQFVPVLGIPTFLTYAMRQVNRAACGVKVEVVPWASGKHRTADAFAWFMARWARRYHARARRFGRNTRASVDAR